MDKDEYDLLRAVADEKFEYVKSRVKGVAREELDAAVEIVNSLLDQLEREGGLRR